LITNERTKTGKGGAGACSAYAIIWKTEPAAAFSRKKENGE
jgi:hypothetical protein